MTTPNITVRFSGSRNLTIDEVWPAGDAPEVVDTEAVRDFMERAGGNKYGMLLEFDLTPYVEIDVEVSDPNQQVMEL